MPRRQLRVVGLAILLLLDVLLLTKGAEKLDKLNLGLQTLLRGVGPGAVLDAFHRAEQACWASTTYRGYHNSGCDWSSLSRSSPAPLGDMDDCIVKNIPGCHDYQAKSLSLWIGKHASSLSYVMHELWGEGFLWGLVWLMGIVTGIKGFGWSFLPACVLGPVVGSLIVLALDWTLIVLTIIFNYALATVMWINLWSAGFLEVALQVRELAKGVEDVRDDVEGLRPKKHD